MECRSCYVSLRTVVCSCSAMWPLWSGGVCLWQPSTLLFCCAQNIELIAVIKYTILLIKYPFKLFSKNLQVWMITAQPSRDNRALFTPNSLHHSEYLSLSSAKHSLQLWSVLAIQAGQMETTIIGTREQKKEITREQKSKKTREQSKKEQNCHRSFLHNYQNHPAFY